MKNGQTVAAFEREFADYVGAKYAIALCNGTATLHTALVALGVKPGDRVAVPPLTMSATTIAVLQAGAVPVFVDVDPRTWLMEIGARDLRAQMPVALYGLRDPNMNDWRDGKRGRGERGYVLDAAQTLTPMQAREHGGYPDFVSYSFQASKILALGEGGMLCTNDEQFATRAREFSSLGYRMRADQPRIDPDVLKSPTFDRHYSLGFNYRMNDVTAAAGLEWLEPWPVAATAPLRGAHFAKQERRMCAAFYRSAVSGSAVSGCDWLTPQHIPEGWTHDYWTYAVACDTPQRALDLSAAVVKHGGERPFPCWKLTYDEPAFRHLAYWEGIQANGIEHLERHHARSVKCPVAESLQPRLLQFQTNDLASAERNAAALRKAIEELS